MPPFPHEKLPVLEWSLSDFNHHAQHLIADGKPIIDFLNLALAGRWKRGNQHYRVTINPFQDCYANAALGNDISITRDFDSLIGITTNLPLTCTLAMYPVPNFQDSLRRSNHLLKSVQYQACSAILRKWLYSQFQYKKG
jgi:hypothetical protein